MEYAKILGLPAWFIVLLAALLLVAAICGAVATIYKASAPGVKGIAGKIKHQEELEEIISSSATGIEELKKTQDEDRESSKKADQELRGKLQEMEESLDNTTDMIVDDRLDSYRQRIIDFASACGNKRPYTREQFSYIFKIHRTYNELIDKYGKTNDEVEISMKIINAEYERRSIEHDFLEDKLGYKTEEELG